MTSPKRPKSYSTASTSPIASRKTKPSATAAPMKSAAPIRSKKRNAQRDVLDVPASATAILVSPGTNLAKEREAGPKRTNVTSVCRTQESGESEMRQSVARTRLPKDRPAQDQARSAGNVGATANS